MELGRLRNFTNAAKKILDETASDAPVVDKFSANEEVKNGETIIRRRANAAGKKV